MEYENGVVLEVPAQETKIVVKFKTETQVKLRGTEISNSSETDISAFKKLIEKSDGVTISRLFDQTEEELDRDVANVRSLSGNTVGPLSGFYMLSVKDEKKAKTLLSKLESYDYLEEAYIEPPAVPAFFDMPDTISEVETPATPNFRAQQGYLDAAPGGIDAVHAWTHPGGKGTGIKVIDIEGAWNFNHEDLLQNQGGVVGGVATTSMLWENHGTAVQGEIAGDENGFGVVGITPKSNFCAVSIFGTGNSTSKALKTAADQLNAGDIILIELHRGGPNANGQGQFGYIAIEWWPADFAAVQYATAKGIIVIAAAGNGSQDLDAAVYQGRFNRGIRDSGAILVGAGAPPSGNFGPDRSRLGFSNYGALIDAQGWGREVVTCGYGDLQGGGNKNKHYTKQFSGTSSASPIIVGAVAALQGIKKAAGATPLTFQQVRQILRTTGTAQTAAPSRPVSQRIGNRPNLKQAIAQIGSSIIQSGIASRYWLELKAYPTGSARSLWLHVNNRWVSLDNPTNYYSDHVQRAFLGNGSQVKVWYNSSNKIVGLIVEGN